MNRSGRRGFSLPELLVVIGIIGMLAALILPPISDAREAARRVGCASNLAQLGKAVHAHVATNKYLPGVVDAWDTQIEIRSVLVQISPFLSDEISVDHAIQEWRERRGPPPPPPLILHCPSDPQATGAANSYRMNKGSEPPTHNYGSGVFSMEFTWDDVTDGLASTALFSERLVSRPPTTSRSDPTAFLDNGSDVQLHVANCITMNATGTGELMSVAAGDPWVDAGGIHSMYLHWMPPNTRWRDCSNTFLNNGFIAARSFHRQGVNVVACDGSVRFVSDAIDLGAWRAFGTSRRGDPKPELE